MTDIEQQQDYLARVQSAAPKVDAILKEHELNLGAQFDPSQWPKALRPVPIYTDTKDYSAEGPSVTSHDPVKEPEPVESPIQREDLEPEEPTEDENDPL